MIISIRPGDDVILILAIRVLGNAFMLLEEVSSTIH